MDGVASISCVISLHFLLQVKLWDLIHPSPDCILTTIWPYCFSHSISEDEIPRWWRSATTSWYEAPGRLKTELEVTWSVPVDRIASVSPWFVCRTGKHWDMSVFCVMRSSFSRKVAFYVYFYFFFCTRRWFWCWQVSVHLPIHGRFMIQRKIKNTVPCSPDKATQTGHHKDGRLKKQEVLKCVSQIPISRLQLQANTHTHTNIHR